MDTHFSIKISPTQGTQQAITDTRISGNVSVRISKGGAV